MKTFALKTIPLSLILMAILSFNTKLDAQIYEGVNVAAFLQLMQDNVDNPNVVILDVRTPGEYNPQHLEGAINRNYYDSDFTEQLDLLDKNKTYLIHCFSGGRSGVTIGIMEDLNFVEVYDMLGGISAWNAANYPTTNAFAPRALFVSPSQIPLSEINIGQTDIIPVTVTNRANSSLTFSAMATFANPEFTTDFDASVALMGSEDYTFNIFYTPTDEILDTLTLFIESNGGNLEGQIIRNGTAIVATHDINDNSSIEVFPNPVLETLYFNSKEKTINELEVIDINGHTICKKVLNNTANSIDLSTLQSGHYYVKFRGESEVFVKKIVVE